MDKGKVENEYLETNVNGIHAAGDVARFYSPIFGRHLRLEHNDVAVKNGMIAGANMAGQRKAFDELPYFYSYQFDLKLNAYGDLSRRTGHVRRGQLCKENGFMQFYLNNGNIDAVLSINRKWEEIKRAKELVKRQNDPPHIDQLVDEQKPQSRIS